MAAKPGDQSKKGRSWGVDTDQKSVLRASLLFLWVAIVAAGSILLIVDAAEDLKLDGTFRPEILLPLIVIAGVVVLLVTLAISAAIFGLFDLADKQQALGLPAGSVQAVIALSLILIFAVVALYATSETGSEQFTSTGLTAEEAEAIPPGEVIQKNIEEGTGDEATYEVVRSVSDPDQKDMNTQLLTTVSTLVIAVAGFYFGSKSAQEGSQAALEATAQTRTLAVIDPPSPHKLGPEGYVDVKVQSVPAEAQLRWEVQGDEKGELVQRQPGQFRYVPSSEAIAKKSVTLYFEQTEDPKTSGTLVVEFPDDPGAGPKTDDKTQQPPEPPDKPGPPEPPEPPERGPEKPGDKPGGSPLAFVTLSLIAPF